MLGRSPPPHRLSAILALVVLALLPVTATPGANASAGGMARLPGGTYTMGETKKNLTVQPFLTDETEVTMGAYAACVKAGKCRPAHATVDWPDIKEADRTKWSPYCNQENPDRVNHPVNCVDWNQATAYCARATQDSSALLDTGE